MKQLNKTLVLSGMACLILGTVLFTTACGNDARARVRVVHASPDAPNVDVLLDNKVVLTNVAYQTASPYLTIKAGQHTAKINPTGSTSSVITAQATFAGRTDTTILAVGKVAGTGDQALTALVAVDDNTPPTSGNVKVRVIHASPSAGNVDIYVTAPAAVLTTPTLGNVSYKTVSSYLSVPVGDYEIRVFPAGSPTTGTPVIDATATFTAGQIRTVVALDANSTGSAFTAIILPDLH